MKTLVTIATYKQSETACFLREKLQDQNINCFFVHLGGVEDKTEFTRVQVDTDDVEYALKVMMNIKDAYGKKIEELKHTQAVPQILVPTDFSNSAEDAARYAVHLGEKLKAEINLLYVFENPVIDVKMHSSETFETYIYQFAHEEEQKAKAEMIDFSDKIRSYMEEMKINDVVVHSSVAMGNVVRTLKRVCRTCKPDMIILGTEGTAEGPKSVLTGVAKGLVSDLKIPLFAIPGQYPVEDIKKMKILYATDFNENDNDSLSQLLRITEPFQKQIACVHIDTAHNPANEKRIDDLNESLKKEFGQHNIECILIDYVNVYQGLKDFAHANKINLLSFTIHKRSIFDLLFMPNLFKKILQESNLPILIFPS
jgi:nucleotide-binding universal stress UspA family protein